MRALTAIATAVSIAVVATGALAQSRPDFSGTWTLDWTSIPTPSGRTGPGTGPGRGAPAGGNWGETFTAVQTASALGVSYVKDGVAVKFTVTLDGTETKNLVPAGRQGTRESVSTASWVGSSLVVVTRTAFGPLKRTLSLDAGAIVFDIEEAIPEGAPITSRIRYTRQ